MTTTPSQATIARMACACQARFDALTDSGCDADVAADRTFDALRAALGEIPHPFDSRDRLFETRLRAIAAEGNQIEKR